MPSPGDVVFILEKNRRFGYQVGLVEKIVNLDVFINYLPGNTSKPQTIVKPIQGLSVAVRQADAKENIDYFQI